MSVEELPMPRAAIEAIAREICINDGGNPDLEWVFYADVAVAAFRAGAKAWPGAEEFARAHRRGQALMLPLEGEL